MKKRVKALIMAVLMLLVTVAAPVMDSMQVQAAGSNVEVKLHYKRTDGNYENWCVWMWDYAAEGWDHSFVEENGEMVATHETEAGALAVGFIVKVQDWSDRELIDGEQKDRFVDLQNVISGTVHVYVEQGDAANFTVVYGDDCVQGTKVAGADYDLDTNTVNVQVSALLDDVSTDTFKISNGSETVEVTAVNPGPSSSVEKENLVISSSSYTLALAEELNVFGAYTLEYDGNEYNIKMPTTYKTEEFISEYTYDGDDLGSTWSKESTTFKVWSPTASEVKLNLYESGTAGTDDLIETVAMEQGEKGVWAVTVDGDLNGTYYTYSVTNAGVEKEACDPYARTTGVNGDRAMVIDLESTNPEGWENDTNPNAGLTFNDAVIYELHVRDASIGENSGVSEANKGNFLGLIESGTTTSGGVSTVLDHMVDLGITHLHLLPIYDFSSVDETVDGHNWGYDPKNYNVPEGSYSSDPYNGEVRVSEMKQMVQGLHNNGISVVMDVVYNHVSSAENFCFNQIVPNYFSRINDDGSYSGNSGCGNDTASENAMVQKYIVDSVKYWADEYHIDGFRFDLVGLIDVDTINDIMETVWEDHPDVVFYGEGWEMNSYNTGISMTTQKNSTKVPGFAFFNDTLRDAIKGSVFDELPGYVSGAEGQRLTILDAFYGLPGTWCETPTQTINYSSCHDNHTLYDRLKVSRPDASEEDIIRMNNLAAAITITSEGIPFIHAGEELLRSKPNGDGTYNHNSYNAGDEINSIKWESLEDETTSEVYDYYKGLIAFRKEHAALRMTSTEDVTNNITEIENLDKNVVAVTINGGVNGEESDGLVVIFNPNTESTTVPLPEGNWDIYINDEKAGTEALASASGEVTVNPISAMVLVKADAATPSGAMSAIVTVAAVIVLGVVIKMKKH